MTIKTYDQLLQQALSLVDDTLDKREGSLIYTALAPVCALLAQCYAELAAYYDLIFADTACDTYLDRVAAQFGLTRKAASAGQKLAEFTFTGDAVDLTGQRFSCGGSFFAAEQAQADGTYLLIAEESGTAADTVSGTLTPCEYIPGLASGVITQTVAYGTDGESDESLRARLLAYLADPAFGGNQADYRNRALQTDGVGCVQVFTADELGAGQVGLVLGSDTGRPVSDSLTAQVQTLFGTDDSGAGLAPIGHTVTVRSCVSVSLPVSVTLSLQPGFTLSAVAPLVEEAVADLLSGYDFSAAAVSLARVIAAVLTVPGVADVSAVSLNGAARNYTLSKTFACYQVPAAGKVTVKEAA